MREETDISVPGRNSLYRIYARLMRIPAEKHTVIASQAFLFSFMSSAAGLEVEMEMLATLVPM